MLDELEVHSYAILPSLPLVAAKVTLNVKVTRGVLPHDCGLLGLLACKVGKPKIVNDHHCCTRLGVE
jgi:hypothetical protein